MSRTASAVLLAALALAACTDAAGPAAAGVPAELAGTYVLRDVAGDPLPAAVNEVQGATVVAAADTLRFEADGRGTVTRAYAFVHDDGRTDAMAVVPTPFSYAVVDGRIRVAFDCPIDALALCVEAPHLVLRADGDALRAEYSLGMRVPQRYERVVR